MVASNRDLIGAELDALLGDLDGRQRAIRDADAALRVAREAADEVRLTARNLRMAVFALDGDMGKTVDDADSVNEGRLAEIGGV